MFMCSACTLRQSNPSEDPIDNIQPTAAVATPSPETAPTPSPEQIPLHKVSRDRANPRIATRLVDQNEFSTAYPAIIEAEVAGHGIMEVKRLSLYESGDGRQILLSESVPVPHNVKEAGDSWPAGVHELTQLWTPEAYYLTNGTDGVFATAEINAIDGRIEIAGRYRDIDTEPFQEVALIYSGPGDHPDQIISKDTGHPLEPAAGAEFLVINAFLDDQGSANLDPALRLTFDDEGRLVLEKRPLPAGSYEVVYLADKINGRSQSEPLSLTIAETTLAPESQLVVNPEHGFQFWLPAAWNEPHWEHSRMASQDPLATVDLAITVHPEIGGNGPGELSSMALQVFGDVSTLYQDQRSVADQNAHRTIYSYDAEDDLHTGVLVTWVKDGTGFVFDLDGRSAARAQLTGLADMMLDSWLFRPAARDVDRGEWRTAETDLFSLAVPSSYIYEELENGWHRMTSTDGRTFLALRSGNREASIDDLLLHWQMVAASEVAEFAASGIHDFEFVDESWKRLDFEFIGQDRTITNGFLQAQENGFGTILVWGEAPQEDFEDTYLNLFMPAIASISLNSK